MITREIKDPYGIRERREALGWSQAELGALAGTNGARVGQLERGETEMSRFLDDIRAILDRAEAAGIGAPLPPVKRPTRKEKLAAIPENEMPVYMKQPSASGGMEITGAIVGMMRVPRSMLNVKDPYAVQIWGSGMAPKYHPKDIVIVNPQSPPRPFGGVLCMNEDRSDVCIGEFVTETEDEWVIARFGATPEVKRLPRSVYTTVHAIVCVSTDLVSL